MTGNNKSQSPSNVRYSGMASACSVVVNDLRLKDEDKQSSFKDKDLVFKDEGCIYIDTSTSPGTRIRLPVNTRSHTFQW